MEYIYQNLHLKVYKQLLNEKAVFVFLIATFLFNLKIFAQHELSLKLGHEIPMGELKWIYKSAPSISISYANLRDTRNGFSSLGIGLGFFQFRPQQETFYYLLSDKENGKISYSNYKVFQLFFPLRLDFSINEKFDFFGGADIGYYYIIFDYENNNPYVNESGRTIEGKGAFAPKAGINYNVSEKFGFTLQARYNLYFSLGQANPNSAYYNSNLGLANHFFSSHIGTYLRF